MKYDLPLISVIVPVFNTGNCLEKCIGSIINQTYRNIEIILINDGSTDNSGDLCDIWAKKEQRVRVYHKPNEGLVNTRKKGVALSYGEYVAYVDSDDWIEQEMYAEMMDMALKADADIVTTGIIRDYENHSIIESEGFDRGIYESNRLESEYWPNIIEADKFFKTNVNMHITNKLFKKKLVTKCQMAVSDQIRIGEDAAVIYPAIFDSRSIAVVGKSFYHYVIHSNSMMSHNESANSGSKYIEKRFKEIISEKKDKIPKIEEQLERVMLYNRFFTEPEKIFKIYDKTLYPFTNLYYEDKVIVYGAGRFGERVVEYLNKTNFCKVIAWCDKAKGEKVMELDKALCYDYHKIVIAVLLADVADEIEQILMVKKVEKDKICRVRI